MVSDCLHSPRSCKRHRTSGAYCPSSGEDSFGTLSVARDEPAPGGAQEEASNNTQGLAISPHVVTLVALPEALVFKHILPKLDAKSLVALAGTSRYFCAFDAVSRLPATEAVARDLVLERCGGNLELAKRWRHASWAERLFIEDSACGFNLAHCEQAGFRFFPDEPRHSLRTIKLPVMGPKLLVSDLSTADVPVLRWRLRVRGNNAVEFGVVPASIERQPTALHKCLAPPGTFGTERAVGFCSQITAGSSLPVKLPVMKDSVVEVVARKGSVEYLVTNPENASELHWMNGQPKHRAYRGPNVLRWEHPIPQGCHVKLAVTSWAKGIFEVLHHVPYHLAAAYAEYRAAAAKLVPHTAVLHLASNRRELLADPAHAPAASQQASVLQQSA